MADVKPRLESGEGPGHIWEDVFLATDAALVEASSTEDGTTATALLVWRDSSGNTCLQVNNPAERSQSQSDPHLTSHRLLLL